MKTAVLLCISTGFATGVFLPDWIGYVFPTANGYDPEWVRYLYGQELAFIGLSLAAVGATLARPGLPRVVLRLVFSAFAISAMLNIAKLATGGQEHIQALQFGAQIAVTLFSLTYFFSLFLPPSLGGGKVTGYAPLWTVRKFTAIAEQAERKARLAIKTENHLHHHLLASSAKQALIMRHLSLTLNGTQEEREMLAAAADDAEWLHHTIEGYVTNPTPDAGTAD